MLDICFSNIFLFYIFKGKVDLVYRDMFELIPINSSNFSKIVVHKIKARLRQFNIVIVQVMFVLYVFPCDRIA